MKAIIEITDYNKEEYMKGTLHVPFAIGRGDSEWYDTNLKVEPYEELNDRELVENEVWEFAKNIIDLSFRGEDVESKIYNSETYKEAKINYEEWNKKRDTFKVGDMVLYVDGTKGVVTKVFVKADNVVQVMWADGTSNSIRKSRLTKTDKHFSGMEDILKEMNE